MRALTAAKPVRRDSRKSAAHLSPSALVKIGFTASMVVKLVVVGVQLSFTFCRPRGQPEGEWLEWGGAKWGVL